MVPIKIASVDPSNKNCTSKGEYDRQHKTQRHPPYGGQCRHPARGNARQNDRKRRHLAMIFTGKENNPRRLPTHSQRQSPRH
ncbi:hypothetical protein HSBAA_44510 [Vreelandella sulfidaeris]|uniref:Uncharacterized protein n=1 Tax=Vreelandella sulfidaeris TaxID=115553 RepID=A0A455UAU5_9GAMM|nr:hypothetical protein HSBAA_44510 [Halomonas sulfidaeris]